MYSNSEQDLYRTHHCNSVIVLIFRCYSDICIWSYYIAAHAAASCYILFTFNDQETVYTYTESIEFMMIAT